MSDAIKILIDKYLRGECSPAEEQLVIDWLEENDLEDCNDVLQRNPKKKIQDYWEEMVHRFPELEEAGTFNNKKSKRRWLVAAVSIGILFLGALAAYWTFSIESSPQYVTGFGEVKRIVLPDGTGVTLNAKSSLTLNEHFNKKERIVELSGQAFFRVKEEADIPFIVKTKKVDIKVLGTSFDVSAFEKEPNVSVALKEGKVLVQSQSFKKRYEKGVLLKPGEEVVIEKKTSTLTLKKYDKKVKQAWKRQDLYFKDAGMKEVLHKLHRFYGVSFETRNLKDVDWHLSGRYSNQTLKEVLESLSFNYGLRYKMLEDKVILFDSP